MSCHSTWVFLRPCKDHSLAAICSCDYVKRAGPAAALSRMEKVEASVIRKNENAFMRSPPPRQIVALPEVGGLLHVCEREWVGAERCGWRNSERRDASDSTESSTQQGALVRTLSSHSSGEDGTKKGKHQYSRICPTELKSVGSAKLFWQSTTEYMFTLLILTTTAAQ